MGEQNTKHVLGVLTHDSRRLFFQSHLAFRREHSEHLLTATSAYVLGCAVLREVRGELRLKVATLRMAVILMIAAEAMSFTLGISRIGAQPTPVALLEAGHAVLIIAAIYFAWGFLTQLVQEPESRSDTKN